MQTSLEHFIQANPRGEEADRILRACVHCGFCTATCPTYQLLGDELDGPRGRIYQIKEVLEGNPATGITLTHLDRCLTCRSCETTCPSGVNYHRLLDIGREEVIRQLPRPLFQRLQRRALIELLGYPARLKPLLRLGQLLRPLAPAGLRRKIPASHPVRAAAQATGLARRMLLLEGCVQAAASPHINQAARRVLNRAGIRLDVAPQAGCCGALPHHLDASARARAMARANIDAWLPRIEAGAEAIVVTASGCGAHVHDYGHLLADDPAYATKAERIAALARDPVEVLLDSDLTLPVPPADTPIAVHTPCTLQHALRLNGALEKLLGRLGFNLVPVAEGHLCCGSAGTYSILQAALSEQLRERKLTALQGNSPGLIVSANIGCILHLDQPGGTRVRHWLEVVADALGRA